MCVFKYIFHTLKIKYIFHTFTLYIYIYSFDKRKFLTSLLRFTLHVWTFCVTGTPQLLKENYISMFSNIT